MDTANLYHGLTFLAWTSVIFLIIIGAFLVKLLFDFSKLLSTLNGTADIVKDAAEPILSDVKESVSIITKIVKKTENQVVKFGNVSGKAFDVLLKVVSKASVLSGVLAKSALKGFWTVFKTFCTPSKK